MRFHNSPEILLIAYYWKQTRISSEGDSRGKVNNKGSDFIVTMIKIDNNMCHILNG